MKKIMVLAMTALLIGSMPVAAFARGGAELRTGHTGGFHGNFHGNNFRGHHGGHYAYRRGGCCVGGYYGDDDDSIAPFIAGGVLGAIVGGALNR